MFAFVILHYLAYEETINCVKSIKENIEKKQYIIIVVDNGSDNNSGKLLLHKFKNDENVYVELSSRNLGFAQGNNLGIRIAQEKFLADFVCVLNNDIELLTRGFDTKVLNIYERTNFGVLGPEIILKDGRVNPLQNLPLSLNFYKTLLRKYIVLYIASFLKSENIVEKLYDNFGVVKQKFFPNTIVNDTFTAQKKENMYVNIQLHGCCLIFSPRFFEKLKGFNDKTFLYFEEPLLLLDILKNNLTSVYSSEIKVLHLEDVSTNHLYEEGHKKRKFVYKNYVKSLRIIVHELNEKEHL